MSKLTKIQKYLNELQPALPDDGTNHQRHEYIVLTNREYVWSIVCETADTFGKELWNRVKECSDIDYTIVSKKEIDDILTKISESVDEVLLETRVRTVKHLFK